MLNRNLQAPVVVAVAQLWGAALLQGAAQNGWAQLHNCVTQQQMPVMREETHFAGNAIKNILQFVNCSS